MAVLLLHGREGNNELEIIAPTVGSILIACHECDLLHEFHPLSNGEKASCTRCGATLYKKIQNSIERSLALYIAALLCFFIANSFPFLSLQFNGRVEENILLSGAFSLYHSGMGELGLIVFLTSTLFPLIVITGMIYILTSLLLKRPAPEIATAFRVVRTLMPWSLLGVLMLGILLAIVKLQDLAEIIPGFSLFAFIALLFFYSAAVVNFDLHSIWPHVKTDSTIKASGRTARDCGLVSCHSCNLLLPMQQTPKQHKCPRCFTSLHSRKANSYKRTQALVVTASLLLIPANLYPIMTVVQLGQGDPSTIIGGIIHLIEAGMLPLGMIVLFASIIVPLAKLGVLTLLLDTTRRGSNWRTYDRSLLYRITEVVGAWSMVDIYLIAVLSALVNLDALATIKPESGAQFFAAAVVVTMFAAHSFDPRSIWDNASNYSTDKELPNAAK